jgi:hypothetical protein
MEFAVVVDTITTRVKTLLDDADSPGDDIAFAMAGAWAWQLWV